MNEDQVHDLLREIREEPVPTDSLARVRRNVAERTRRSVRWKPFAWAMACAAIAFAGILLQSGVFVRRAIQTAITARPRVPEPVLPVLPRHEPPRQPVMPAIRRVRVRPRPAPVVQTVSIRIETPDPDVVILLVGE
ncbi:MAG TPA: hypothetical protein VG297_09425 [Bryobacteraceae bacterium]|nr:hypothetical protein [Bryobacteraceae bacterium]